IVFAGLVTAWRFASWPTSRSPVFVKATTDGTVRPPSAEAMTVGSPPSITATTLFVVPRSMPMILPMRCVSPVSFAVELGFDWWLNAERGSVRPSGGVAVGCRIGRGRDRDEGRPKHAVPELVAAPDDVDDLALGSTGAGDVRDGLVLTRVERAAS